MPLLLLLLLLLLLVVVVVEVVMVVCRWRRRRGTSEVGGLRRPAAVALGPPREVDVLALGAGPVAGIGGGRGTWGPAEASCSPSCPCRGSCRGSPCG